MLISILVGTALGFLSGLGIGGGSLLILWLTLVMNTAPHSARIINLLFFLPSAVIAVLFRWKQGSVNFPKILPAILAGAIAALLFSLLSEILDTSLLRKLFGGLLILTGIREISYKPKSKREGE